MYRKAVIVFALAGPAFVAGLVRAQMPTTKVVVGEARMIEARATITLVATVEPLRRSRVGTEISGLVVEMPAREGDRITMGDILCRLNDDRLSLQLAAQKARLAGLQSRHQELLAGTRKQELRRLKALYDEAVAEDERWEFEMARIEGLRSQGSSNAKEYEDTKSSFRAAERRRIAIESALNLGIEGPRVEQKVQAAYAVEEQQAVVDRIATDLGKTIIRPPFAGFIVKREVEVGEWIGDGDTVVEMVDLSSVLVRVHVPESCLLFLTVGDPVRVKVDALDRTFEGNIKHIVRQADPNARTFPVEIEVPNPDEILAAGMFARATLPAGPTLQIVAVPRDGIVERDGTTYIGMVLPGHEGGSNGILVAVTVGMEVDDMLTITSGNVRPGTPVIIRGTERILPFPAPIEIVDEMGTPVAMPGRPANDSKEEGA